MATNKHRKGNQNIPNHVDINGEVVFIHKLLGDLEKLDLNIFGLLHWRVKIFFLISITANRAPRRDSTLFIISLKSSMEKFLVPTSPG